MKSRVLVVDDNAPSLELMAYLVRSCGYETDAASNAAAALAEAQSKRYDLILTDLRMPGMDGFEMVRRLREMPDFADTRIVAVTASAMAGDRERVLAQGFDAYISKPIEPPEFIAQVKSLLKDNGDDSRR